ncbi:uncharacterized protein Z520_08754 [Fonsecaea multimorphosa CBS 102226]|uniref:Uncharacterized protein n=1 Tax=Fonsecaea multimorphosa CBS 102226 TaxID=1442371 RepID=A0A0D2JYI2_9EURO|nr:uncharacterized protein Z520_08754 [Fonsecaea multimorphosa CBS 102226]KIX95634.1 hypothetical protein Z520_08754 [Fonsecaea multimorphosa CBS 102226]
MPDEMQEAPFNQHGVRLDRGLALARAYKTMWNASLYGPVAAQSDIAVCDDHKSVNASDCGQIVADLRDRGADEVPALNATRGNGFTIAKSRLRRSPSTTPVPNTTDGMVGGSHVVRHVGNCGATVTFLPNPVN